MCHIIVWNIYVLYMWECRIWYRLSYQVQSDGDPVFYRQRRAEKIPHGGDRKYNSANPRIFQRYWPTPRLRGGRRPSSLIIPTASQGSPGFSQYGHEGSHLVHVSWTLQPTKRRAIPAGWLAGCLAGFLPPAPPPSTHCPHKYLVVTLLARPAWLSLVFPKLNIHLAVNSVLLWWS